MPVLAVLKVLRERLTDEGVDELITILHEVEEEARKDSLVLAEEKFGRRLAEETGKLRVDLAEEGARLDKRITEEIAKLRVEMAEKFAQMETKIAQLETKMTSFKAEIIKWMFLFWVGQLVVVAGLIKWLR